MQSRYIKERDRQIRQTCLRTRLFSEREAIPVMVNLNRNRPSPQISAMYEVWRTTFWLMRTLPCGLIHIYTMGQNAEVLQVILYLLTIKAGYRIFNNTGPHLNYKNLISQLALQCPTSRKNWPMKLCSCYEVLMATI